jgi:hypothetical protein
MGLVHPRHPDKRQPVNISDPAHWPRGFVPLRFELGNRSGRERVAIWAADGCQIAELTRLKPEDGSLVLDDHGDAWAMLAGAWSLDVIDAQGRVIETHLLWRREECVSSPPEVSPGVAAWSALTVLWTIAAGDRPKG